jgi:hypothetical protein
VHPSAIPPALTAQRTAEKQRPVSRIESFCIAKLPARVTQRRAMNTHRLMNCVNSDITEIVVGARDSAPIAGFFASWREEQR